MKIKQGQTLWLCTMKLDWKYTVRPTFIAQDSYPLPPEGSYADYYPRWFIQDVIDEKGLRWSGLFKSRRKAMSYAEIMNGEW